MKFIITTITIIVYCTHRTLLSPGLDLPYSDLSAIADDIEGLMSNGSEYMSVVIYEFVVWSLHVCVGLCVETFSSEMSITQSQKNIIVRFCYHQLEIRCTFL